MSPVPRAAALLAIDGKSMADDVGDTWLGDSNAESSTLLSRMAVDTSGYGDYLPVSMSSSWPSAEVKRGFKGAAVFVSTTVMSLLYG